MAGEEREGRMAGRALKGGLVGPEGGASKGAAMVEGVRAVVVRAEALGVTMAAARVVVMVVARAVARGEVREAATAGVATEEEEMAVMMVVVRAEVEKEVAPVVVKEGAAREVVALKEVREARAAAMAGPGSLGNGVDAKAVGVKVKGVMAVVMAAVMAAAVTVEEVKAVVVTGGAARVEVVLGVVEVWVTAVVATAAEDEAAGAREVDWMAVARTAVVAEPLATVAERLEMGAAATAVARLLHRLHSQHWALSRHRWVVRPDGVVGSRSYCSPAFWGWRSTGCNVRSCFRRSEESNRPHGNGRTRST